MGGITTVSRGPNATTKLLVLNYGVVPLEQLRIEVSRANSAGWLPMCL